MGIDGYLEWVYRNNVLTHWYIDIHLINLTHMPKRNTDWNARKTAELFEAILSLKTKDECRRFFRDLCTLEEMADMSDRWQMVKLLVKGISYRDIAQKLAVSTTTVARVANWTSKGEGGYQLVVKRLKLATKQSAHHQTLLR